MDSAAGNLPVEHTDETLIGVRAAMQRDLRQSGGLLHKTSGNVRFKLGRNISMAVYNAKSCRVNYTGQQNTSQHTRN